MRDVVVLVGSLRTVSFNRKTARALQEIAQGTLSLEIVDIGGQQPEVYLGGAAQLFDQEGRLINDDTRAFLKKFIDAFATWIEKTRQA